MDTPSIIFYEHDFNDSLKTSLVKNVLNIGNECRAWHQRCVQLEAEVEQLKEGNDCLGQMHDKEMERSAYLLEEFNRTTAWGRGLESDLSHARVEISFLKAEVERLTEIIRRECDGGVDLREEAQRTVEENHKLQAEVERLRKAGDDLLHEWSSGDETDGRNFKKGLVLWHAAKEGKQV